MVLGLVMIAGDVGTSPRNGRAVTDDIVVVLRGYNNDACVYEQRYKNENDFREICREEGRNNIIESYHLPRYTCELTHGGL
jgi:hypothetical protein